MSDNHNDIKTPKRGKTNGYNSAHLHAKHNRKRQEAADRQREHDSLTINEKIEKLRSRRGDSKRELARLMKLAADTGVVVTQPVAAPTKAKAAKKKTAKKAAKKKV
jgi:hypothetical protein